MQTSKTKRIFNAVIYLAMIVFVLYFADGAVDHISRAGNAIDNLRSY